MDSFEESAVLRVLEGIADSPILGKYEIDQTYQLCLMVEREINVVHKMGIDYKEIHNLVRDWLKGDV